MKRNKSISKPVAIVVEGVDFLHFIRHRIMNDPNYENVWLYDFKEKGHTLAKWLKTFRVQDGFEKLVAVGIIRDKEENGKAMEKSVHQNIANAGFVVPDSSNSIKKGTPSIAYLLVPTERPSGCLEHAMLDAVTDLQALTCARKFVTCVQREKTTSNWEAKALVRSLIAVSDDPDRKLGPTSTIGLWDWDARSLKDILQFIKTLNDFADSA